MLLEHSVEERRELGRDGTSVAAAIAVQLGMAGLLAMGLSGAGQPGTAVEPTVIPRAVLLPAALALPAVAAIGGWFGRPSLFVAAAVATLAAVVRPVSIGMLILLFPAAVFLRAAALRAGSRGGTSRVAAVVAVGVVALIVASVVAFAAGAFLAFAAGAFLAFWTLALGGALLAIVAAILVLVRLGQLEHTRTRAARAIVGTILVAALPVVAFTLPLTDTMTVCWTAANGAVMRISEARADELGRPAGATTWVETSGSPGVAVVTGTGCDGDVPSVRSEWLSAAALACALVVAFAVVPRRADGERAGAG